MTAVPLINYPPGYNNGYITSVGDSGVVSECGSLDNPSTLTHNLGVIDHDSIPLSKSAVLPESESFVDTSGKPTIENVVPGLSLPTVVTIQRPQNETIINPLLDNCYQRAITQAKQRLLKGEILYKNGEWRIPGAPVPSRPDYSKVKPVKDKSKHRRRKAKHQRSETYPQVVLKDKKGYDNTASTVKYLEPISLEKSLNPSNRLSASQPASILVSEIGNDYVGRSYVQFTDTAVLYPKYLSAADVRTRNDEKPQFCYGCRSNVSNYDERVIDGLYDSVLDVQECHHEADDSLINDVPIKYDGDVAQYRFTINEKTNAPQAKSTKYRRVGGGFLFYENEAKTWNNSLPKWAHFGAAENLSNESVLFNVDKLQEPDGPVYQPTIPRDTRSPYPQFIRERQQLHKPELSKPKIHEPAIKYNMNHHTDCFTDGGSSMTSGLGTSINSEVLKRQTEEENEARRKEEDEMKARQEAKRKAEEEEKRQKEESRKNLYKAPNPFKLKDNDKKTTVSTDPFSKNRSYNVPQPNEIDIKKGSKPVTKPQEFKRTDSNWKEPKKFELKQDDTMKTTQFWEAPKGKENPKSSTKPKLQTIRPELLPSPSPVAEEEVGVEPVLEKKKKEPQPVPEPLEPEEESSPSPEPSVIDEPTPMPSVTEPDQNVEVQKSDLETSESSQSPMPANSPPQEPLSIIPNELEPKSPPRSPTPELPLISELVTQKEPTPELTPTPTPEYDPTPENSSPGIEPTPTKEPTPQPPNESTPPPKDSTPPPKKPTSPLPPKAPTPILPPLPQIEEANPIITPLKKPEKKIKLKRLQTPKPLEPKKERPKMLPDLKPAVKQQKQRKHEPKKIRTVRKITKLPQRRKQQLPLVQPKEPVPVSLEPEPPPETETFVLPPLPLVPTPVINPDEEPTLVTPTPIVLPSPPAPKKEPIIWKRIRKQTRRKSKAVDQPASPEHVVRDPLDYLAKYCIVHKNRINYYERVFSKLASTEEYYDDEYVWNENSLVDDEALATERHPSKADEFQNTFGRSAKSPDVEEYISPKDIAMECADNRQTSESPTSDLDSSTQSPRHEATGDSIQIQQRLDKLSFILDNVYSKVEQLHAQIHEYEEQHNESVKVLARAELEKTFREKANNSKQSKAGKKKGKGKGKTSEKHNSNSSTTLTVGGTPKGTPRGTPRGSPVQTQLVHPSKLTDDQIVARISSAQMRMIQEDPCIRKIKFAKLRANEKLEDMEKWISELKNETSLMSAQVLEQTKREEDKRQAKKPEFRREQSSLYKKMNPLEEHNIKLADMEPLLEQINGQLITKKECQYVYHILNLPQRHKLNFKLFTVVAALSEKVSRLEPFVKKMINKMDFEALDVKMQRAKELFRLLEDECDETYPGEVTLNGLSIDLQAGGLRKEHIEFVVNKFGREGNGIVDFLDFLTYLPLFIDIHGNIVNDPLNRGPMTV
ncbi:nucleolar protein dao-5-like isoform X2 [Anneissia japonica]|uniref:nucleolar protein dao-5-like isoform X2 n=1 Tax=Anneissia japonica TaxID=1529436 RepID=UPI0014255AD7|nr:nucleolar protein dao-5-like isoform X2 [Anneissia japonica]